MRPDRGRDQQLEDLTLLIHELLTKVETRERYTLDVSRNNPEFADASKPLPTKPVRRQWKTRRVGLLVQLEVGIRGPRGSEGGGRSGKPGSRPPGSLAALEEYSLIVVGVDQLRRRVRVAAGRTMGERVGAGKGLREISDLCRQIDGQGQPVVDDKLLRQVIGQIRSWRSSARIALGYDVEIIELAHRHCLECGGKLVVRKDATSDVWCRDRAGAFVAGPALEGEPWPIPHQSCGAVWPRNTWIQLLQDIQPDERKRA